jgi:hypothetical protein
MLLFLSLARNPQRIQVVMVVVVPMPRSIAIGMVGELLVVRLGLGIAEVEEGQTSAVGLLSEVAELSQGQHSNFGNRVFTWGKSNGLGQIMHSIAYTNHAADAA